MRDPVCPTDYSKTPEEYLVESRMSVSEQRMKFREAVAWAFVFCFLVWIAGLTIGELWGAYQESLK